MPDIDMPSEQEILQVALFLIRHVRSGLREDTSLWADEFRKVAVAAVKGLYPGLRPGTWAKLLDRSFGCDYRLCPNLRCGKFPRPRFCSSECEKGDEIYKNLLRLAEEQNAL